MFEVMEKTLTYIAFILDDCKCSQRGEIKNKIEFMFHEKAEIIMKDYVTLIYVEDKSHRLHIVKKKIILLLKVLLTRDIENSVLNLC